jgi:hypothetical protein
VKVSAQIASLKWSRPEYAKDLQETMGAEVNLLLVFQDISRLTIQGFANRLQG